jgi:hypothetical protein
VLLAMQPGEIEAWAQANGLPLYDVGTPSVPRTSVAVVHQGEQIRTAAQVAADGQLLRAIEARLASIEEGQTQAARAIVKSNLDANSSAADRIVAATETRAAWEQRLAAEAQPR